MASRTMDMTFERLEPKADMPYGLLLLADPSKAMIDAYVHRSEVYIAQRNGETLGAIVLLATTADTVEIKNLAVRPDLQRMGIGSFLIENAVKVAVRAKRRYICIGTANSSIGQIDLYQKLGFELSDIRTDFFLHNYPEPVYENGIQAKDMLMLTRPL